MIGKLRGNLDAAGEDSLLIDVGGVGYIVFCSRRTLGRLPPAGGEITLLIETHVREDHIHLYGFAEAGERDWFRLLSTVQGVGARMALNILSVLGPQELLTAIAAQDKSAVTQASGVGPKLAQRIITELKDKAGAISLGPAAAAAGEGAPAAPAGGGLAGEGEDAVSALTNLGYKRVEAFGAVAKAQRTLGEEAGLQALIKEGLKELSG
jgi:Holliday junction DNA helicase RuvA